jgi:potassium-dependent mechanosensitive channel
MRFITFFRALLCAVFFTLPLASYAQSDAPNYEAWTSVAQRAEIAVENGRASTGALEALRSQIVDWRERFLTAQTVNRARIETLTSQIASLGTPADGASEATDISERRIELNDQLKRLRSPIVAAEEAYSRADGVIKEIDRLIRERQTDALLSNGPIPLNPAHWGPAIETARKSLSSIAHETSSALKSDAQRKTAEGDLVSILILLVIGLVLILRGRRWSLAIVTFLRRHTTRGTGVWRFIASLLQILLPFLGLSALVEAAFQTGFLGLRGTLLMDNVAYYGLLLLGFWWLGGQLFARDDAEMILPVPSALAARARWYVISCALVLIAALAFNVIATYDNWNDASRAVIGFPIILLTGLILFRLGRILQTAKTFGQDEDERTRYRLHMSKLLGQAAVLVAVLGPLLAAIGYGNGAARLVFSTVATLALFGLLLVIQGFVKDLYTLVMRKDADDQEALVPVLLAFALVLGSLPILALIWGARGADITEVWTRFQEGFSIGESRISPSDFVTFAVLFSIGYMATRLLQGAMRTSVLPRTKLDTGGRNAIVSGIGYVGIFLAAVIAISSAGIDLSSLAIVAGALSVGIGFGLQNIVSNFVSGIILLIERPIAEGDWIEVGGHAGYVRGISVRSTRIETFDRTDVIVPNADLVSGTVTNWTRGNTIGRVIVPVGVAYGTDTRKVEDVLIKIAREHPMVLLNPNPSVVFQGFGADSMDFEIRAILRDVNFVLSVKSEMNHEIAKRFAEENIEIPFAQRDVWLRNPEALMSGGKASLQGCEKSPPEDEKESDA